VGRVRDIERDPHNEARSDVPCTFAQASDARKFDEIWGMKESEVKDLLGKVLQADKIIHEQQLGLYWYPPSNPHIYIYIYYISFWRMSAGSPPETLRILTLARITPTLQSHSC
jgi:hypothetical protein